LFPFKVHENLYKYYYLTNKWLFLRRLNNILNNWLVNKKDKEILLKIIKKVKRSKNSVFLTKEEF